jgi:PAS domain S-box-containing protein
MPNKNSDAAMAEAFELGSNAKPLLENLFDLFGTLDADGVVIDLFGSIFETVKSSPKLLIGQPFNDTVFWQSNENTSGNLRKAIAAAAAGSNQRIVLDFRINSKKRAPMELNIQPLHGSPDTRSNLFITGKIVDLLDERYHHSRSDSEQLLLAADNANIGLWYWKLEDKVIHSTPKCNELFGLPPYEPATQESFMASVHPEDRAFVEEFARQSREDGTRFEEEFRVIYKDHSVEWLCSEGRTFLDENGRPQRMLGVVQKITEQKESAAELAKVYEREKKALDAAVDANRAKDLFLAVISHELRSPLNAIQGWSKILLTKELDEKTRISALETIERSARFQTKLINDLVDSSRVASGKLKLEYRPYDLYDIVSASFDGQKPSADSRGVEFTFDADTENVTVFGDPGRLQQVFSNLMSNAIKFTPEGGKVSVTMESDAEKSVIKVRDTGRGISPEAMPLIFQQFSQGDAGNTNTGGGLGLGLSIAKILVERHGGSISAASEGRDKGSVFTVTLPLNRSDLTEAPRTDEPGNDRRLEDLTILLVEDNNDSREVAQLFLEQNGAVVTTARSASEAMEHLTAAKQSPDIIISDIAMPDEDGYTFIKRVRKMTDGRGKDLPALVLSAFATKESRSKALAAGFQRYSTKPFDPETLVRDILELTSQKK